MNKLPRKVPSETILTSFHIKSLYTNIPHDQGIKAIEYWLTLYPESIPRRFFREFVIEGINLILNNNTYVFNDTPFLQKKDTAMGTRMAPSYATPVLGYLEGNMYDQAKGLFGDMIRPYIKDNWLRYLDDCFINWIFGEDDLRRFHIVLNSLDPNIQFTTKQSTIQLAFLDILIKRQAPTLHRYILQSYRHQTIPLLPIEPFTPHQKKHAL